MSDASPSRRSDGLPDIIVRYLEAHDRHDTDAALSTFAPDATVADDGHEYADSDAIRHWLAETSTRFTYTRTLVETEALGAGRWQVTNHLEGDFPREGRRSALPVRADQRPDLRAGHRNLTALLETRISARLPRSWEGDGLDVELDADRLAHEHAVWSPRRHPRRTPVPRSMGCAPRGSGDAHGLGNGWSTVAMGVPLRRATVTGVRSAASARRWRCSGASSEGTVIVRSMVARPSSSMS